MVATMEMLIKLATRQLEIESQIEELEEAVKEAKKAHLQISTVDLPEAMDSLDVVEFVLANGRKVSIVESVHAKIPEERKDEAFTFLREHDYDGVIKRNVILTFGKGEDHIAASFLDFLKTRPKLQGKYTSKEEVHHSTLKALVKEFLDEGIEFPEDAFGLFVQRASKIK